ncbi:MAG TPA: hypothetical protein VM686_09365 [Polyangiaceae bacterium]|nr:hypothetical protein [Polyangiaceae bacterium]
MRHSLCRSALAALAVGFALTWSHCAEASGGVGKAQLSADLDWISADVEDESWTGFGGGLRLGYEIDVIFASLIPEIGGTYHSLSDLDTSLYRGVVGGRLRFLKILEPGVYAHFGVGHASTDNPLVPSRTASTGDVGLSLDFTLLPVIEFGAHAGYTWLAGGEDEDSIPWWNAGLQASVIF